MENSVPGGNCQIGVYSRRRVLSGGHCPVANAWYYNVILMDEPVGVQIYLNHSYGFIDLNQSYGFILRTIVKHCTYT